MVSRRKICETEIVYYSDAHQFLRGVAISKPPRVYIYDPKGELYHASFLKTGGKEVHLYETDPPDTSIAFRGHLFQEGIGSIDGFIDIDKDDGSAYQHFKTLSDSMNREEDNYLKWRRAVKELPKQDRKIEYFKTEKIVIVDAHWGTQHLVLHTYDDNARPIHKILDGLRDSPIQDNSKIIGWFFKTLKTKPNEDIEL